LRCCILRASIQSTSHPVNYNTQTLGKYISSHVVLIIKHQNLLSQMAQGPFSLQRDNESQTKVMKNESSFFIEIILQYNIVTFTYFMLHVKMILRHVLCINKVLQTIYYICTFGLLERENANTVFQSSMNSMGYCSSIYRQGTQPKQKYNYDHAIYTLF
jgi:hypothetical protein